MDVLLYLIELLQTRKTIGIVGLGTLYKKKSPGKYDAEKHAFVPPSYTLAFTTVIKEQEELANYISHKRNITTNSANYYISEFVEQIQTQLADQQEANLEPIGKLKLVNDEVIFIAEQESIFGFEFYGLPTLTEITPTTAKTLPETVEPKEAILEEIEEENKLDEENPGEETTAHQVEENVIANDEQPVYDEIAEIEHHPKAQETIITEPPIIETTANEEKVVEPVMQTEAYTEEYVEEEEPKKGIPFFMKFLIVFLVIVAAGAIAYFINPQFFNQYIQKNFEGKPDKSVPIVPNDSLKIKADSAQTDSLAKNNALVALVKDSTAIDSTKVYYEVIGTAEETKAAADAYITRVAKRGIHATVAKMPGRRVKVSLGTFMQPKSAQKLQDSLRILLKNSSIYVQPIKPKK